MNRRPSATSCCRKLAFTYFGLAACLMLSYPEGTAAAPGAPASEELLIFTRPGADSEVARKFEDEHLPMLRRLALELGVALEVIDVEAAGAPAEVHLTPTLVYLSHRGRAFFQGRYVDSDKVAHFIRTQRVVPPSDGSHSKRDAAVLELGRARIEAPIKVTALGGKVEAGFDADAFALAAHAAILDGFQAFELRRTVDFGTNDRALYMDFHPYRAEDGRLWVSTALFSQFNCIEPVYVGFDSPISGPWDGWRQVFGAAARQLESEVMRLLGHSALGDGFDAIPASVTTASWRDLGLELPARPAGRSAADADVELPTRWRLEDTEPGGAPRLVFRFPSPLERYSGEVREIDATLRLPATPGLAGATGRVEVATASVTMGEDSLDAAVRGKMIHTEKFPRARFELGGVGEGSEPLAFGRISRLVADGTFTMMGLSIPLEVRAQLEPIIGADGEPRLHVQAGFEIRLVHPFGVKGPDGPAPANDTLQFHLDFLMTADAESKSRASTQPRKGSRRTTSGIEGANVHVSQGARRGRPD